MTRSGSLGTGSVLRSWVQVLVDPREFFREDVVAGGQAPGLVFAMTLVGVEESIRLALVAEPVPVVGGQAVLSKLFWLAAAVLVVTPVALHLLAALQTLLLVPFVDDRGTVSETIQVLGYATAPCVLAGVPVPSVRVVCTAWGAALLALGVSEVHGPTFEPSAALSALPAALVFGYGFHGFDALAALLTRWYII